MTTPTIDLHQLGAQGPGLAWGHLATVAKNLTRKVTATAARLEPTPRLTVRHADLEGRLRLDVPTLYRNRRDCESQFKSTPSEIAPKPAPVLVLWLSIGQLTGQQ